jgi:hypothetical protein
VSYLNSPRKGCPRKTTSKNEKMEDDLQKIKEWKTNFEKMEDDLKKDKN